MRLNRGHYKLKAKLISLPVKHWNILNSKFIEYGTSAAFFRYCIENDYLIDLFVNKLKEDYQIDQLKKKLAKEVKDDKID